MYLADIGAEPRIPITAGLRSAGLTAHRASLPALTSLRFFAAAWVVVYHTHFGPLLQEHGHSWAGHFFSNGNQAVMLFFLLSGFILSYTYEGQIERRSQDVRFWQARYSRVWPMYAVSLLACTLLLHTTPAPGVVAQTLLMVQSWNPFDRIAAGAWNFVCWTLSAEALFYLLFPFVQRWVEVRSQTFQRGLLAVVLLVTVVAHTGSYGFGSLATGVYRYIPLALIRVPDFIAGMALGNLYLRFMQSSGSVKQYGGLGSTRVALLTWAGAVGSVVFLSHPVGWWTSFAGVSFAALIFGLATERSLLRGMLSWRILMIGGQISYAMYLLQVPCIHVTSETLLRLGVVSVGERFGIGLLALIAVSAVCFYGIEDPSRKLLRSAFARLDARRTKPGSAPA